MHLEHLYAEERDDIFRRFLSDPSLADEIECYEHYQEDLDREAEYEPPVVKVDTVEEPACWTWTMPMRTVTNYNRWCRQGQDEEFGKAAEHLIPRDVGPFYAVYAQRFSEEHLMVNAECQVLRNDGTVIPGQRRGGRHLGHALAVISELTWAVAAYRSAVHAVNEMEVRT